MGTVRTVDPVLPLIALATAAHPVAAQHVDSGPPRVHVAGAVTVTNRGISLIPSFTLGRPAAIFDVAIRIDALSFEPQFRFGLDGKPWSFLFWWRYRVLSGERFRLGIGAHPAILFRTTTVSTNGVPQNVLVATRYLAGELSPSYALAKHLSVGVYYLYSHGLESGAVQHTHFVASRATLTNMRISDRYFVQVAPQLYYLRTDDRDGFYFNSALTLADRRLPLSIAAMLNQALRTRIVADRFLWNVSLTYSLR